MVKTIKLQWMNKLREILDDSLCPDEVKLKLIKIYGEKEEERINKNFNEANKELIKEEKNGKM